jgi:hypothetical protein
MSIGVIERVYMPSHLGVVFPVDTRVFDDESEGSLPSRRIVEDFDERIIREVNTEAEDIEVQDAHCIRGDNGRSSADGDDVIEEIPRC